MGSGMSQDDFSPPTVDYRSVKLPGAPQRNVTESGAVNLDGEEKGSNDYKETVKDVNASVDRSSTEKLSDQLKKNWPVDEKTKNNCFILHAKDLSITWGENTSYWHWPFVKESSGASVVAAELLNVCWLDIRGRFNTVNLAPRTLYEVVFVVMLKDPAYGWQIPVNLRLVLANGSTQEHKENMMEKLRGKWVEIPAGEFETLPENNGDMEFSMYEHEGGIWKRGLVVKGVIIRPKK